MERKINLHNKFLIPILLSGIVIGLFAKVEAQNQFGLVTGNYSGLNSLKINPANICYQPISLDLNIIGGNANINNNHFYTTPTFLFGYDSIAPIIANRKFSESTVTKYDFIIRDDLQSKGYAFAGANIMGPSLLLSLSTKRTIAFTTALRSHASGTNVSGSTALALFEGPTYSKLQNTNMQMQKTKLSFASWFEMGLSYAQVVSENLKYVHRIGGSLKMLLGTTGGYIYDKGFNAYNETGQDLQLKNANFSYAYAGPDNTSEITSNQLLSIRGMGASIDLGYSIQQKDKNSRGRNVCPNLFGYTDVSCGYKWKAGISLLDIGAIKYYNNSFATDIYGGNSDWKNWGSVLKLNPRQIDSAFKTNISSRNISSSESFWIILPGAISAQFDYRISESIYLNSSIAQRITPSFSPSLARMNSIAIIPRFEKENVEISIPLVLNEYKSPNMGLAFRFKYILVGSDRFGETFGFKTMYGADFYVVLRYCISERCKKVRNVF